MGNIFIIILLTSKLLHWCKNHKGGKLTVSFTEEETTLLIQALKMVGDPDDPLADGILAKYYSQKVKENDKVKVKKKIGFI